MSLIYEPAEDSYLLCHVLEKELPLLLKQNPNLKFLEIGVGSGIQLETAKEIGVKKENIFGVDKNMEAVNHCRLLGFEVNESDLFENVVQNYDVIVFNPPYLPEDSLEDEESKLITTGGVKGSEVINEFLIQAKERLNKKGKIFLLISS